MASVADVHRFAAAMPGATLWDADAPNPIWQVSRRSFVYFRNPRPDAVDPVSGERYDDVIVFWVADEGAKQTLLADAALPFFTTPHFDGHNSVLVRGCRLGELDTEVLREVVEDAWLARAGMRAAAAWLAAHPAP